MTIIEKGCLENIRTYKKFINDINISHEEFTESSSENPLVKVYKALYAWAMDFGRAVELTICKSQLKKKSKYLTNLLKKYPYLFNMEYKFRSYGYINAKDIKKINKEKNQYDRVKKIDEKFHNIYDYVMFAKNIESKVRNMQDKEMAYVINKYDAYLDDNIDKSNDSYVTMQLNEAIHFIDSAVADLEENLPLLVKQLTSLKLERRSEMTELIVSSSSITQLMPTIKLFKHLTKKVTTTVNKILFTIDAMTMDVKRGVRNSIEDKANEYILKNPNDGKQVLKAVRDSKHVKQVKIGDVTFDIWEMPYKNISCMNVMGKDIFVTKNFFKEPEGIQLAVLYHEFGHTMYNHFGTGQKVRNEDELYKSFEKTLKQYKKTINNTSDTSYAKLNNYDELVYLLVELDADRYAAKVVGKPMMRKALDITYDSFLKYDKTMKADAINYNKERMDIRTKLI